MKKIINILISFCLIPLFLSSVCAQNNFKVSISMGKVLPLSKFKSTDNSNLNAGFAKPGFTLNFDGDYYISHRLALSARLHFGLSQIDNNKVYEWLKQETGEYYDSTSASSLRGYWQWSSPLLGLKYNYPLMINKLYFETGIFSGLNITQTPTQSMIIKDTEGERSIYSENISKTSYAVPLMIDAGLRFRFNENIQLKLQGSYYQSKASYTHETYIVNDGAVTRSKDISIRNISVPLKTFNLSIGLVYSL